MRYLTITYYHRANGQTDEALAVHKSIGMREIQTASIILDFKTQTVTKATISGDAVPKDWDTVVAYYYEHYKSTFERMFVENGHKLPEVEVADVPEEAEPSD